jgi:uncharacterized circularly permuted ATP-grasp superfamily protein/uncharacterized alpha-E superfamily protein
VSSGPSEHRPEPPSSEAGWQWENARASSGVYDEFFDTEGRRRPGWDKLADMMGKLGQAELRRRWDHARQLLREHGVSYDAYGDSQGTSRPWNLSPIPVVLEGSEWTRLAKGLAQRARLLDAILADLYGPRRLLERSKLPPEVVLANPAFLRPCVGIVPAARCHLPLYAADLGRGPDGRFVVLADRTRAPSGAGYALENRIVLSRSLPEVFRECGVERLAVFFRAVRDTLRDLAPQNRDNPRIVLLTPGPYNATYFEQAFFAQYLGLTLVQGGDLTVRDRRVYLKTLGGLQPVDVIVRRVRDDYCDSLELRPESTLGVPGLVEAARAGRVSLANPIGSGLLQSPAILPFLPSLCRELLGEDLAIASVPTYWCGDRESLAYVEAHLRELVFRAAFPGGPVEPPIFAAGLTATACDELRARIRANPHGFVGQESFVLSTVPTLTGADVDPGHLWMRAYAVVSGTHYEVMPGALSRVGGASEQMALSLRPGGESKDTWVLAGGAVSTFSLLRPDSASAEISRGGADIPSRLADNLFWLGRYAERAEGTARLARAIATRLSDQGGASDSEFPVELDALFRALEARTGVPHPRQTAPGSADPGRATLAASAERALFSSVLDGEPAATLSAAISSCYRVARTVRDRVSQDTWRTLAQVNLDVHKGPGVTGPGALAALVSLLNRVIISLAAFGGLGDGSMSRGLAWRFLDAGRRLERAIHMVSILRAALAPVAPNEGPILEALLDVADSSMTYRRRYLATLQVAPVVDLLLTDETNPRSAVFQTEVLADHLQALPMEAGSPRSPQQKLLLEASSQLRLADVNAICAPNEHGDRPALVALLDRLGAILPELSMSLSSLYLGHAAASQPIAGDP